MFILRSSSRGQGGDPSGICAELRVNYKKVGNLYVEDAIPKTTYRGVDADNKNATVWNILVASEKLSDQVAYNIVKTMIEKRADLIAVHKEAEAIKIESQKAASSPIPFHPGALKFFAEKGVKIN